MLQAVLLTFQHMVLTRYTLQNKELELPSCLVCSVYNVKPMFGIPYKTHVLKSQRHSWDVQHFIGTRSAVVLMESMFHMGLHLTRTFIVGLQVVCCSQLSCFVLP